MEASADAGSNGFSVRGIIRATARMTAAVIIFDIKHLSSVM